MSSKLYSGEGTKPCSAQVQYNDRSGPCKHEAKYPDADGVRWWCGIHNPERNKARPRLAEPAELRAVVDKDVLLGIKQDDPEEKKEMLDALTEAKAVLLELSAINDAGWPPNTPIEKYRIMMAHMAGRAAEVAKKLHEQIVRFSS